MLRQHLQFDSTKDLLLRKFALTLLTINIVRATLLLSWREMDANHFIFPNASDNGRSCGSSILRNTVDA